MLVKPANALNCGSVTNCTIVKPNLAALFPENVDILTDAETAAQLRAAMVRYYWDHRRPGLYDLLSKKAA